MNRQFLTTLMLFLLVITGYNQFVALPRARAEKAAAEEKLKQAVKEQTPAVLATAEGGTSVAAAAASSQPEELISFDYQDADVTFSSKGAGIKKYIYKDVVEDVNLTPFDTKGFLPPCRSWILENFPAPKIPLLSPGIFYPVLKCAKPTPLPKTA